MAEALLRNESPAEYFKELVETAMDRQHLAVRDLTSFYLVNLLTGFVHFDRSPAAGEEPLGIRLARALQTGGSRQRDGLREVVGTASKTQRGITRSPVTAGQRITTGFQTP